MELNAELLFEEELNAALEERSGWLEVQMSGIQFHEPTVAMVHLESGWIMDYTDIH